MKIHKHDEQNLSRIFCYTNVSRHSVVLRVIYTINVFLYFLLIVKLDAGMYAVPLDAYKYIESYIIYESID